MNSNNFLLVIQARMSSSRFPGKSLAPLHGKPMIIQLLDRLKVCKNASKILLATSTDPLDDKLTEVVKNNQVPVFRGPLENVLERFYLAAISTNLNPDYVIRITGDCPVIDPFLIDEMITSMISHKVDYLSNVAPPTFPDGLDVEIFTLDALKKAYLQAALPSEKEHVTLYIRNNEQFTKRNFINSKGDFSHLRWTVDEPEDLEFISKIYERLHGTNKLFDMNQILELLEKEPELLEINSKFKRNEGLIKSIEKDSLLTRKKI